jgi:uroporphyrinogen III methyltransferase / synthase
MAGKNRRGKALNGTLKTGVVYLIGAGPGHPGLITRMGYDLLQRCDAVAFDSLIPLELVSSLPGHVERHYVGRRAGRHSMPQTEKNQLLVELARRGLNVVRLKGGDTAFFSAIADEVEALNAAGIQAIVVPGVTAASAVSAAAGLSLTDRRNASWAFFATGHGASDESLPVPWQEIAALRGGTAVIYMGLANLEKIAHEFIIGGHAENTPCMAVSGASTGIQQIVTSRLKDLVADCRQQKLMPPALVVIGNVVQSRYPSAVTLLPLTGKRVLTPCCAQETESVCAALRTLGAEPLPYPAYVLKDCEDKDGWDRFSKLTATGGWCLFASELEIAFFTDGLLRHNLDWRALSNFKVAAVGPKCAAALTRKTIKPDVLLHSTTIAHDDLGTITAENLIVFSEEAALKETEWAEVLRIKLFHPLPAVWESHWRQEIRNHPPDYILFRNAAEINGFVEMLGKDLSCDLAAKCILVAMDDAVETASRRQGLKCNAETRKIFSLLS